MVKEIADLYEVVDVFLIELNIKKGGNRKYIEEASS